MIVEIDTASSRTQTSRAAARRRPLRLVPSGSVQPSACRLRLQNCGRGIDSLQSPISTNQCAEVPPHVRTNKHRTKNEA